MKLSLLFLPIGLLCLAHPAAGQQVRGGIMGGASHAVDEPGLERSIGLEGWIGVELPALPIMPRAAFAYDRFNGAQAGSRLTLKSARLDVLGILRTVPLEPYALAGVGIASTGFTSTSTEFPVGIVDPGATFAAGIGAGRLLGPIRLTAEARYLTVPDADLNAMQLRLGIGF